MNKSQEKKSWPVDKEPSTLLEIRVFTSYTLPLRLACFAPLHRKLQQNMVPIRLSMTALHRRLRACTRIEPCGSKSAKEH